MAEPEPELGRGQPWGHVAQQACPLRLLQQLPTGGILRRGNQELGVPDPFSWPQAPAKALTIPGQPQSQAQAHDTCGFHVWLRKGINL